jgi:hypothetical protein
MEQGHLPQCLMREIDDPLGVWDPTTMGGDATLPWESEVASWNLGEVLDPNRVLPSTELATHDLDDVCEVLRSIAGETEETHGESGMSPGSSHALRIWLEEEQEDTRASSMEASSLLPSAWANLHAGLETLATENGVDSQQRPDVVDQTDELATDGQWDSIRCLETRDSLERPGRPWPTAHELADALFGDATEETVPDELEVNTPVRAMVESPVRTEACMYFTEPPASPEAGSEEVVVESEESTSLFRPIFAAPVTIPLEPIEDEENIGAESDVQDIGTGGDDEMNAESLQGSVSGEPAGREVPPSNI